MRVLGLGFTNPVGTGGILDVCLCFGCGGVGGVGGEWAWTRDWRDGVQVSVYCSILHCSILFHLMDICFLTCICLLQISHIQTRLFNVIGPGLVSTSPVFVKSSASHPAGPHERIAPKTVDRAPIAVGGKVRHNLHISV